jgi:hypothetical protein
LASGKGRLESGKPSKHKIDVRSQKIIRHDYEQALTACARLASYAAGEPIRTISAVHDRQQRLAIDDLVLFAIHSRRLMEKTTGKTSFDSAVIPLIDQRSDPKDISIWRVINTIVHYEDIEIVVSLGHAQVLGSEKTPEQALLDGSLGQKHAPLLAIKSDRNSVALMELRSLMELFQESILDQIVDFCAERHLFLDE